MWFVLISCLKISEKEYQSKMAAFSATEETGINDTGELAVFELASNDVTVLCAEYEAGAFGEINGITYTKRDIDGLRDLVVAEAWSDLETSCTSDIIDMSELFKQTAFNGNISSWDVSAVRNMEAMFYGAGSFNRDISRWDVSSAENMKQLFLEASSFNGDLSSWDVSSVEDMSEMFVQANSFNGDLSSWNTSSVVNMSGMFGQNERFNRDISDWDVSGVNDMDDMFNSAASFNQDLSSWCVSQFSSQPSNFDTNAINWTESRPVWGTCP